MRRRAEWNQLAGVRALLALCLCAHAASADDANPAARVAVKSTAVERMLDGTPDDELTGTQIYERVLANRFDSFRQSARLVSGDRSGKQQATRFNMWFDDTREPDKEPAAGSLLSRTLVRYTHPFDIRHTGYLVLNRLDRTNDQFLYIASERRVKRINLRGEAVFGTDFSLEDVFPREVEDADYERLPDVEHKGEPCFQVQATPKPEQRSEYSRFVVYVEKTRYLPLLTRYWDSRDVEIKQLDAPRASVELHQDVWVPMRLTMTHLKHESFTTLEVNQIDPNPTIRDTTFDLRSLESH